MARKYHVEINYIKCFGCNTEFSVKYTAEEGTAVIIYCPICLSTGQFDMSEPIVEIIEV